MVHNHLGQVIIVGEQIGQGNLQPIGQPLRGINVWQVDGLLIAIDARTGDARIQADLDPQALLGKTGGLACLSQSSAEHRLARHMSVTPH